MNSDKKVYLAAIVVLAFGIGNSQITKHMDWFQCVASQISSRLSNTAIEGENRVENVAQRMLEREQNRVVRRQNSVVNVQMKMACAQARMAQRQAEMVRKQVERVQIMNLDQVQRTLSLDQQNAMRNVLNLPEFPRIETDIQTDIEIDGDKI